MTNVISEDASATFLRDAMEGLGAAQKNIPGKYLWDEEGSRIFESISRSADYYQTQAEERLTMGALTEVASIIGAGACLIEFGSGASQKVRRLLDGLQAPSRYVALDISRAFLEAAAARVAADYPQIEVFAVCADYSQPLPSLPVDRDRPILGFLPGTSIGNMSAENAGHLLAQLKSTLDAGFLLIGQDPNRDPALLQKAYEGPLMTALHKNVLERLRRELGATLSVEVFRHESRTFTDRVEPHLVALQDTRIEIGGKPYTLVCGESIRTDVSWKYTVEDFSTLVSSAGWSISRCWRDAAQRFCLYLLDARG